MPSTSPKKLNDVSTPLDSVTQMTIIFLKTIYSAPNATRAQKAEAKKLIQKIQ